MSDERIAAVSQKLLWQECREFKNIGLFCNEEQLMKDNNNEIIAVNLPNIMHKEVLQEYNIL